MLGWIDALRGLAILMVLANHVALVVPGLSPPLLAAARFGQMGVQLFFVVSAYTLCLSWQQRHAGEPQPTARFLLRRFFRIAPLYWFGIALFAAVHFLQPGETASGAYDAGNVLANALFVHGFVPAAQNTVVPGGWSIGTEMAFYALFPLLMALLARRPGVAPALLGAALALALNLLLQAAQGGRVENNGFAYFHLVNQLPVFMVGIALFRWHQTRPQGHVLAALALCALALAATALLWRSSLDLAFALVPATAAVALAALAHAVSRMRRLPLALQAVGRASFAIYIVHVLFAWHALRAVGESLPLNGDLAYLAALAVVAALSQVAAQVLGRWIERPGIALGRRAIALLGTPRVNVA